MINNKRIKVILNGERMKDIYPYATNRQVWMYKYIVKPFRKLVEMVKLSAVVGVALLVAFMIGRYSVATITHADTETTLESKIESLQNDTVNTIKSCESKGLTEADGAIILDTNNKMSIGQLMFQKATVVYYYKTLYGQDITPKDAVSIALDTQKASTLAKDIIFKTDNGLKNWLNCSNRYDLVAKVAVIKSLTK